MGGQLTSVYPGYESLPDGVPVYLQWIDQDGAVSPVYSATTHDLPGLGEKGGAYAFAVPQWVDANGKKHRYITGLNQRLRIWFEPTQNPVTGNQLIPLRNEPGYIPLSYGNGGGGDKIGAFAGADGTNGNLAKTGVWAYEAPRAKDTSGALSGDTNYMDVRNQTNGRARFYEDNEGPIQNPASHLNQTFNKTVENNVVDVVTGETVNIAGDVIKRTISGNVWLENGNERQLFKGASPAGNASPPSGYRVYASALTDEGAAKYDQVVNSLDPALRAGATKKFLEDNPQYLAGTVSAPVMDNGDYTLRFPEPIFKNEMRAGLYDQFQDHLYMWVEDTNGNVVPAYSTFTQPVFQNPRLNLQWAPTFDPSADNAFKRSRFISTNFAVVPSNKIQVNIVNYNTTDKPAKRGSVAEVQLIGELPSTETVLEWRDASGRKVPNSPSCVLKGTSANDLGDCRYFKVPDDAPAGAFYYAVLTTGGNIVGADSFVVLVDTPVWNDRVAAPLPDPVTLKNIGGTDDIPELNDVVVYKNGADQPFDAGSYTVDYADKSKGDLRFTPVGFTPKDGDTYKIEVWRTVEVKDVAGNPTGETKRELVDDATISYKGINEQYDPEYNFAFYEFPKTSDSDQRWGRNSELAPKFIDQDGNEVTLRNVPLASPGAFKIDEAELQTIEWTTPSGGTVDANWRVVAGAVGLHDVPGTIGINANTGVISFIPGTNAVPGLTNDRGNDPVKLRREAQELLKGAFAKVPVLVTYSDGTTDKLYAEITQGKNLADRQNLRYGETTVAKGETKTVKPEFTSQSGNKVDTPAGSTFAIKNGFVDANGMTADGYKISVDEQTGEVSITGPSSPDKGTREELDVPVEVTYSDGSKGDGTAKVWLDTDGDGIRDIEDEDDDNDGVPDDQELTDGTNPKDDSDFKLNSAYTPNYEPVTGTAGSTVKVAPPFFTAKQQIVPNPGAKFSVPTDESGAPETVDGVTINDDGSITVKISETQKDGDQISIPVLVTYRDGSTDRAVARVYVKAPSIEGLDVYAIPDVELPVNEPIKAIPLVATVDGEPVDDAKIEVTWFNPSGKDAEGNPIAAADNKPVEGLEVKEVANEDGSTYLAIVGTPTKAGERKAVKVRATRNGVIAEDYFFISVIANETSVGGQAKPVQPNDTEQKTGIEVRNADNDTKVEAKDEDGKDVTAEIKDGKLVVKPGADVDGPIEVTITDPDLPGGQVTVLVPVEGHTAGKDDNKSVKTTVEGNPTEVNPTNVEQDTGLKAVNPDKTTRVEAKDEDGSFLPVRIDEEGKIVVIPGTNVDGPITVTINDDDFAEPIVKEVPVKDHTKGQDDNKSGKTFVTGDVKTVEATDQPQGTGLVVKNPDKDTEVSAKDEDGQIITAVIDPQTGEIKVTPGTNVDGPIQVMITDPDLPGGAITIEVPVEGHTKGQDDNNSNAAPKTTVSGDVKEVQPTDKEQLTGLRVNNRDEDTKVSAKDEDGKDISVRIDDLGNIQVIPGENVDGPIMVTISDPDLPGGAITIEVPVAGHTKGTDDNNSNKKPTTVDSSNPGTVQPTDDPQETGIKVENRDDDTRVIAKDEDGKFIPVEINKDGVIVLTPGTDVDGPIEVTIIDPDLPGGETKVKVEVEGHTEGHDDNAAPADTTTTVTGKVNEVQPTDEEQTTGLKVNNPKDETTVSAKDEDGKTIEVKLDKDGNIVVKPGTDVDGPIMVTITDPDLPGGSITIEVPVAGHTKGTDDNNSDKQPTGVDQSKVETVQPTDEEQDTGIKVENRDEDTRVIAKDEDGKFIPVVIDDNGNVKVTPGTNVDGPIEVTIIDPDLPGGEVTITVPVEGHTEGVDDNAIPTPTYPTTVDESGVKEVQPSNEPQDAGIVVNNPGVDTTVTATDEDGKTIPVFIDKDGRVVVTPGTNVDGPITVTIIDPDLPGGKATVEVPVAGHTKDKDDNGTAVTPGSETDKVPADGNGHKLDDKVQNPTEGMTGTVADKNGNPLDGATATVDPNTGEITVTVPKGTEPGEATVTIKDKDGNTVGEVKIEITNQAGAFEPTYTETKVPAGQSVNTNDPFEGKNAPVAKVDVAKQDAAKDWTFNPVGKSGVINATAPVNEQISAAIKETFPNGAEGETDDAKWNNFTKKFKGYAQPEVGVTVTYTDDSTDGAKANFDLVGKDGKSLLDPTGDFDGDGVSNKDEIIRGLDPVNSDTDGDGIADGKELEGGTNPLKVDNFSGNINVDGPVNGTVGKEITPIDIKGEGEGVTVEIVGGKLPDGLTFENGKITGTPTKAGTFSTTVVSKDADGRELKERVITFVITEEGAKGSSTTGTATTTVRETTVIEPKCIAASVGLGIPLIALIPIGLATQIAIPGLTPVVEEISLQIERANANIQQQIGIFNPETAVQVAEINARLRAFGLDLATVGTGLALIAAGLLAGTIIYEACGPEDKMSSVKDPRIEGSSGKTYRPRTATKTTVPMTTKTATPTTTNKPA